MKLIKVVIADPNVFLREGLKRILAAERDLLVVGEAAKEVEVGAIVERTEADVLLLDLKIPEGGAVPLLLELKHKNVATKVLILSPFPDKESILDTAKAGARGYISEQTLPSTLIQAIRKIHKGEIWTDRQLDCADNFVDFARHARADETEESKGTALRVLSKRELEILALVANGLTNEEISKRLFIGVHTVKVHLNHIFDKLKVKNRTAAAMLFVHGKTPGHRSE